jgi:serine/threonine protein kinase
MNNPFKCRQVDKYDGQNIFQCGKIVYELGNYLGGGSSGSVYQAFDPSWNSEKSVAIKILNPLGYKNLIIGNINQCSVAAKGFPLSSEQVSGKTIMTSQNVWWLLHPQTRQLFAAFEDPQRNNLLRELPLTKCIEIWGLNPLGIENLTENEIEKVNMSSVTVSIEGKEYKIPVVSPKYLKFLKNRQVVCREMNNMVQIGSHPNIVCMHEVLELVQDSKTTLFLVLELINGGELFERMRAGSYHNQEEFAKRYFKQLLSGIEYCHKRGRLKNHMEMNCLFYFLRCCSPRSKTREPSFIRPD